MKTIPQHNFIIKAHSLTNLFEDVREMSTFMYRLEKDSLIDPDSYDPDKYKGDGFEFFVELFLMLHPCDRRTGVYEYEPTQYNDNGVDGIGKNIIGDKCVVQIKFRSNPLYLLTATDDHLSNMFSDGSLVHGVNVDNKNRRNYRHFIFTTGAGLNPYTEKEFFKSKVRCFGFNDFKLMLHNNIPFWTTALDIVKNLK